jgi:hypothetical protein
MYDGMLTVSFTFTFTFLLACFMGRWRRRKERYREDGRYDE